MSGPVEHGLAGRAFVAIWHDITPEGSAAFYEWHDREHMPERLAIPGFLRGRRYRQVSGEGQTFFNLYEVTAFEVLIGPDYLARLNAPTPWTKATVTHFRNVTRGLCRVASSTGLGEGGVIATLRIVAASGEDARLQNHLTQEAIPALLAQPGILGAHLGFTDPDGSRIQTAEKQARNNPTDIPPWVLLVEGISAEHLRQALAGTLAEHLLGTHSAAAGPVTGIYQLEATRSRRGWLEAGNA